MFERVYRVFSRDVSVILYYYYILLILFIICLGFKDPLNVLSVIGWGFKSY